MKRLLITIALVAGLATFANDTTPENLLKNASFEKINTKGVPVNWEFNLSQKAKDTSAEVKLSKEKVKSGANSIMFSCDGDNSNYFAIRQPVTGFSQNDKLQLQADVYIKEFDKGSIDLFYFIISHGGKSAYPTLLKIKPDNCEMNKWVTYKTTLDLAKYKDVKGLLFWILVPKGFEGKFYVDNVQINKH